MSSTSPRARACTAPRGSDGSSGLRQTGDESRTGGSAGGPDLERVRGGLPRGGPLLARGQRPPPCAPLGRHEGGLRRAPRVGASPARGPLVRRVVAGGVRRPRRLAVG